MSPKRLIMQATATVQQLHIAQQHNTTVLKLNNIFINQSTRIRT